MKLHREDLWFGKLLARGRAQLGWSQQRLAQEAGVSRLTVSRVERGEDLRFSTMVVLLDLIGYQLVPVPHKGK